MKCKRCGNEWETVGDNLRCPFCDTVASLSVREQQSLWEETENAERIKDDALRASCLYKLAEFGVKKAQFLYAECLRYGRGVPTNLGDAVIWYKAAARQLFAPAAYELACCLRDPRFGKTESQTVLWLSVAAEFDSDPAAFELSRLYEEGEGLPASHRYALYWLTRAAEAGNKDAIRKLAKMYATGDGVGKNPGVARTLTERLDNLSFTERLALRRLSKTEPAPVPAIEIPTRDRDRFELGHRAEQANEPAIAAIIYFLAAKSGNVEANLLLARCYAEGRGVPKDEEEARRRFTIAAEAGLPEAMIQLGTYNLKGIGAPADWDAAVSWYEKAASAGNAEAAYLLAQEYHHGAHSNIAQALKWYEKAAANHHEKAKEEAAKIHEKIDTVYESAYAAQAKGEYAQAFRLFTLAADLQHSGACYRLAQLYQNPPEGFRRDRKRAVKYYRMAAEQGHLGAIYSLGVCYSEGDGVVCDYAVAVKLLSVAARQHYGNAAEILEKLKQRRHLKAGQKAYSISTICYRKGDVATAIRFRTIAAQLGCARAMYILGCHYEFGDGVPMDRDRANAWYTRAARAGFTGEKGNLKGGFLHARKQLLLKRHAGT